MNFSGDFREDALAALIYRYGPMPCLLLWEPEFDYKDKSNRGYRLTYVVPENYRKEDISKDRIGVLAELRVTDWSDDGLHIVVGKIVGRNNRKSMGGYRSDIPGLFKYAHESGWLKEREAEEKSNAK